MWLLVFCGLLAGAGKAVTSSCPVEMIPSRAAVKYGAPFSANCTSSSDQIEGMGWESSNGGTPLTERVTFLGLNIVSVTDWDLQPQCYINFVNGEQCLQILPVIVYKMPDSVIMTQRIQMVEGKMYRKQCDIINVAPARNLSVHWHRGNDIIHVQIFNDSSTTPVNKSSTIDLTAHRDDNGLQIWCEAKLTFWPTEPNPLSVKSKPHEIIVLYAPTFIDPENEELEIPASGKITLNCTATGNPVPVYSWHFPDSVQQNQNMNQPIQTFEHAGTYNCTASNSQGTRTKSFTVKAKRDRTIFAAMLGVFVSLGVLLAIVLAFFVTPEGTFSCNKSSYLRGQPTSSGPV